MPPVPMTSKRMTANPVRPQRYRPGKGVEESSSEEESDDEDDDAQTAAPKPQAARPPPKQELFTRIDEKASQARREQEKAARERERRAEFLEQDRMEREAGFVTESEESDDQDDDAQPTATTKMLTSATSNDAEDDEDESSSEEDSSSEEESSEDERPRMLRPIFVKKDQRTTISDSTAAPLSTYQTDEQAAELQARRRAQADELIQAQYEERQAAKTAANADWDAEDTALADADAIDDTDGLDPELERRLWEKRELGRLTRARRALQEREDELAELERRRNLSTPEREAEDRAHLDAQKEERAGRGKMAHLQKYHHKGAFYADEGAAAGLLSRDVMGARFVDQSEDKSALPTYLQRRDETRIGKKGATRYRDMRSEDTGRFGGGEGPRRFRDEAYAEERERTGANASALGVKRKGLSVGEAMREEAKKMRTE